MITRNVRNDFESATRRYRLLMFLWTIATALLLLANVSVALSIALATTFLVCGALSLGAAGLSCAYVIARDAF